jgi:glycosyltransferase family protein
LEEIDESIANNVRAYMRPDVRRLHARLIDKNKVYGHTLMNDITSEESLSEVREIWNDKECVFIEGEHTGMGVGNDLFDNCRSIERIICSSESAIDRYDDIMAATLRHSKGKLILLALGPTATALAYDIFKEGYQAVDIGHIDLYYEKYIRDLAKLQDVSIPYKYSNCDEVGQRHQIEPITDQMYLSQIVDRIC